MWQKEKQQKFIAKEPSNYANRKIEKEEQALLDEDKINDKKIKLNKKKKKAWRKTRGKQWGYEKN